MLCPWDVQLEKLWTTGSFQAVLNRDKALAEDRGFRNGLSIRSPKTVRLGLAYAGWRCSVIHDQVRITYVHNDF